MSKLLVVFGATGQQGGSVIDFVLGDRELSAQYKIRGITRNTASASAKALHDKGVEVVQADVEQPETLKAACEGAHTIFSNTTSVYDEKLYEREVATGKAIADTGVAAGAQYIIYSSQTSPLKITGRAVIAFDCKYEVEEYIRSLPIKSAFYAPAQFMQNFEGPQKPRATDTPDEYAVYTIVNPDAPTPFIDIAGDTGKFIGAVLADPDKYAGTTLYAASEMLSGQDLVRIQSEATGKTVKYVCLPEAVYKNFLPPAMQEPLCAMLAFFDKPGYYGPETAERVAWTQKQARGQLTTYAEYLKKKPLALD